MPDRLTIESLGAFYLGRETEPGADKPSARPLLYDTRDLTTHALCVGMTGSGKTGLCLSLIEEAALDNIPVIAIDPKGDLSNLALRFPNLDAASFAPWIDETEAAREGVSPQDYARSRAELWKRGLAEWGQDGARVSRSLAAAELQIFTPGSEVGLPLSILAVLDPPKSGDSGARERLQAAVSSLLSLVGIDGDPLTNREHVFLANVIDHYWQRSEGLSLSDLVRAIADPPFSQIGILDVESFFARSERQNLMMRFNGLLASPGFAAWTRGEPLNIERLLWNKSGKPRISVLSIAHLSDDERMFFVSLLLGEILSWMRSQSGTPSLRAILYMDEVFGFFPPVQNPPSKAPMLTLLKQARAYGLGVILATQNPVDLDYKGLSNCGTWFLGRLQTERDKARLLEGLASAEQSVDTAAVGALLSSLRSREFLMHNVHEKKPVLFHTRWAMSYLRGPLTLPQIGMLMDERRSMDPASSAQPQTRARAHAAVTSNVRPVCPEHITERVLDAGPDLLPTLLAHIKLHHRYRYSELDTWSESWSIYPPSSSGIEWKAERFVQPSTANSTVEPSEQASFAALPQAWLREKDWKALTSELEEHLYEHARVQVYRSDSPKLYSTKGETKEAFLSRVSQRLREERDDKIDALQETFDKQRRRLEGRVETAEARVEKERSQYESAKMQSTISIGGTILGALFGRKVSRSATSSARAVSRATEQKGDIARAQQKVSRLQDSIEELDEELQDQIEEIRQSALEPQVETIEVPPLKSDISVEIYLAWVAPDRLA